MGASKTIDATLRIAAQVAGAITEMRKLRGEAKATSADFATIGKSPQATAQTEEVVREIQRRSAAERQAAADSKRLAKEKLDADRAAARETRRLGEEEAKRKKQAGDEERRRQKAADDALAKDKRQQAYRTAALAPQLQDIGVSLAGGQNPLLVAIQQGGQISQIYGGARQTITAMLSVLTPMRVLVGTIAAGFATVAVNIAAGYRESAQLAKTLALAGDAAAGTQGRINLAARDISAAQGTSVGFVRDVLTQLLATGSQTTQTLTTTARAASALAKLSGQSAEEVTKSFADQADGVTDWAVKANKSYAFLTAAQVAYVRSLERQGRTAEAVNFVNRELTASMEQRTPQALGAVEKAWNAAGRAVAFFVEQIKSIGRDATPEERLQELTKQLTDIEARLANPLSRFAGRRTATDQAARAAVMAEMERLNRDLAGKTEKSIDTQAEQARIKQEALAFQQSLAALNQAEAQKALAQREANLDAEKALVERSYAQELLAASDYALKLNVIEQKRAEAQAAAVQRQIDIERGLTGALTKPEEVQAQQARVVGLQSQLIQARSRIATTVSEGKRLIDAEIARLDDELRRRSADNNLAAIPGTVTDPSERARQTAQAATAQARRDFELLQRDIRSRQETVAGQAGSEGVQQRLDAVLAEARKSLDEATRRAQVDSLFTQVSEQTQALAQQERALADAAERGASTTQEAEAATFAARARALPQLRQMLALLEALATNPEERNRIRGLTQDIDELDLQANELTTTLRSSTKAGFAEVFTSVLTGSKSALGAIGDFVAGVGRSMLNLIGQRLGEKLANSLFGSNAGAASGGETSGGWISAIAKMFASVNHQGGVIGALGGAARAVSPLVFAGAQVLHSGGIAGLRSNEVPAILEAGEEVLTADDPRHVRNFSGNGVTMNATFNINGASGSGEDQRAQVEMLQQMVQVTVERWAATQRRQGGIFS